ncbi:chromosome segregation ATPase [Metabacillus crassostreae]|uniref:hypothetical protein n=1 Tax=Metabacillus crassostreae TaxID=929098 RepID=UPI001958C6B5|nr:hypothetical protein [Metabacillus crassostreae]MBM7603176.1 chromosome segregation ATPase [Metabacillus crassostreae]
MAFNIWKNDNGNVIHTDYIENIKILEGMIKDLQQRLNKYENLIDNMNNNILRTEEKGFMSKKQITDIYERIQTHFEKEEDNTSKILQLENELKIYYDEIIGYRNEIKELERGKEDVEISAKDDVKSKGNEKKRRNIEFANKNQFIQQNGTTFHDTIQRVTPPDKLVKKSSKKRKVKQSSKSQFKSSSELINKYYPKGQAPTNMTAFNPLRYS